MIAYSPSRIFVSVLILLFPALGNLVPHFSSTVLLLLFLMGLPIVFSRKKRPLTSPSERGVLWIFVVYFSVYLFVFALKGLQGGLLDPRVKYLSDHFRLALVFPIYLLVRDLKIGQGVLWTSILVGGLTMGLYGVIDYLWPVTELRIIGAYDAIAFGEVSLVLAVTSTAAWGYLAQRPPMYRLVVPVGCLLGVTACVLSGTRGAWVALPAVLFILFFYLGRYVKIAPRLILVGLCCLSAVIAYHVPATNVATRFQDALSEVTEYFQGDVEEYGSAKARLLTYRAAWHIFQAHPLTGAGPGNYKPLVDQMIARGELPEMTGVHSQPINTFLATLVDCGLLGLAALLGVFAAPLWLSIRYIRDNGDLRNIGYALMLLVVAFAHFGLTESIFRRSIHVNFYVIMVAVIMAVAANEKRTDTAPAEDNAPRTVQT